VGSLKGGGSTPAGAKPNGQPRAWQAEHLQGQGGCGGVEDTWRAAGTWARAGLCKPDRQRAGRFEPG